MSSSVDPFCFVVEGVLLLLVGLLGLGGNSLSLFVYSRQKVHRIFHNLLFALALFDTLYIVCSILLFSLSKFNAVYDAVYRVHLLPLLLPLAHMGLMGSVYCTLAMTIERFLAVCHPFQYRIRTLRSRYFLVPLVSLTLIYNLPKFLELYVHQESQSNCTATLMTAKSEIVCQNVTFVTIRPTWLRTNSLYIRVYILWMNLLVQIVLPFLLLITLNRRTYKSIQEFERRLESIGNVVGTASSEMDEDRLNRARRSSVSAARRREVVLARISLYIVYVFLVCHAVRLFPNAFEMAQTYMEDYSPERVEWPSWVSRVTNVSHLCLTFACSINFFIYYFKHGLRAPSKTSQQTENTRRSESQMSRKTATNATIEEETRPLSLMEEAL